MSLQFGSVFSLLLNKWLLMFYQFAFLHSLCSRYPLPVATMSSTMSSMRFFPLNSLLFLAQKMNSCHIQSINCSFEQWFWRFANKIRFHIRNDVIWISQQFVIALVWEMHVQRKHLLKTLGRKWMQTIKQFIWVLMEFLHTVKIDKMDFWT